MAGWTTPRTTDGGRAVDELRTTLDRRRFFRRLLVLTIGLAFSWTLFGSGNPIQTVTGSAAAPTGAEGSPIEPSPTVGRPPTEQLTPDHRVVAIVAPLAMPSLTPGDVIDLFAVAVTDGGFGVAAEPLGFEAEVMAVEGNTVTIIVPDDAVPAIFVAQARGTIELARRP